MKGQPNPWDDTVFQTCATGKVGWKTRSAASKFAKDLHRKHGGNRARSYRCDECSWFHIGNAPQAMVAGLIGRTDVKHIVRLPEQQEGTR